MTYRARKLCCNVILILAVAMAVIICWSENIVKARCAEMIEAQTVQAVRVRQAQEQRIIETQEVRPVLTNLVYQTVVTEVIELSENVTETKQETESINERDVELLACVIYQEAGGDACCDMCRRRVADVVLNRVSDPRYAGTTIEEILLDADPAPQWGLYSVTGVIWPEKASQPEEQHAVERAYRIAQEVLDGQHSDLTEDYIWCAEFSQGTDVIECDGIYFGK